MCPRSKNELAQLTYPLYFLDYEACSIALPIFDGYGPYQQMVFQYSIHVILEPGAPLSHYEYLVTDTTEPSSELVKRLVNIIGETGSVIVWHKWFECSRNDELAKLQPEHKEALMSINVRTYDLKDPFSKGYYVDYRFGGSASIKRVLPVLCPELSYEGMHISDGMAAMIAWYQMTHDPESDFAADSLKLKKKVKQELLEYCKLDTLAMVRIWEELVKVMSKS